MCQPDYSTLGGIAQIHKLNSIICCVALFSFNTQQTWKFEYPEACETQQCWRGAQDTLCRSWNCLAYWDPLSWQTLTRKTLSCTFFRLEATSYGIDKILHGHDFIAQKFRQSRTFVQYHRGLWRNLDDVCPHWLCFGHNAPNREWGFSQSFLIYFHYINICNLFRN